MISTKPIYIKKLKDGFFGVWSTLPKTDVKIHKLKQVHSSIIVEIKNHQQDYSELEADGLLTLSQSSLLAIQTADCLPVLIIGNKGVAHIHAGWRGLHKKILERKILSKIEPKQVFIGPYIHAENYPVGKEFYQHFPNTKSIYEKNGQTHFCQFTQASEQLKKAWGDIPIESSQICTYLNKNLHSYRLSAKKGRNWNIWIPAQLSDKLEIK